MRVWGLAARSRAKTTHARTQVSGCKASRIKCRRLLSPAHRLLPRPLLLSPRGADIVRGARPSGEREGGLYAPRGRKRGEALCVCVLCFAPCCWDKGCHSAAYCSGALPQRSGKGSLVERGGGKKRNWGRCQSILFFSCRLFLCQEGFIPHNNKKPSASTGRAKKAEPWPASSPVCSLLPPPSPCSQRRHAQLLRLGVGLDLDRALDGAL